MTVCGDDDNVVIDFLFELEEDEGCCDDSNDDDVSGGGVGDTLR
jgi:hypothetical protein